MKANLALICLGFILVAIGVYRSSPLKLDYKSNLNIIVMMAIFILIFVADSWLGGTEYLKRGLSGSLKITSRFLPMLVFLFLIIGLSEPLAQRYTLWLKEVASGKWGYPSTFLAALLMPGSNTAAKFVEGLWNEPLLRPLLLYFMTATPLISWNIFFIRQIGFGQEIVLAMYKTNFIVALTLMPFFWAWSKILHL